MLAERSHLSRALLKEREELKKGGGDARNWRGQWLLLFVLRFGLFARGLRGQGSHEILACLAFQAGAAAGGVALPPLGDSSRG